MNKILLVDAYSLIYRAHFAFISRPVFSPKGINTSAIYGFLLSLSDAIRSLQPTHICIAFDPSGPTFRNEIYDLYKANRQETPDDIKVAVPYIKQICEALNFNIALVPGFEADDVVGTLANNFKKKDFTVYMMTPDKDYDQLVDTNVYLYKPAKGGNASEINGITEVKAKWGIESPKQVIDILALWGDSSDNVPGVPGIGEKTAMHLINTYKNIEGIYDNIENLKGKQKENLLNNKEVLALARTLVTINCNVPLNFDTATYELKKPNTEKTKEIFEELNFKTLINRFLTDTAPVVAKPQVSTQGSLFDTPANSVIDEAVSQYNTIASVQHIYKLVNTIEIWGELIYKLKNNNEICFDTETTGLNFIDDKVIGISFSVKAGEAYYWQLNNINNVGSVAELKPILEDKLKLKIGHNIKFDILMLRKYNIFVAEPLFDTMIAHYILQPEQNHKMDNVAMMLLNYKPVAIDELIGKKGNTQLNMSQVNIDVLKDYACEDADITFQLKQKLQIKLEKSNLLLLFNEIEMPLTTVLVDVEAYGVSLDSDSLAIFAIKLRNEILKIEKEIYTHATYEFNINSPKQLGELLFDRLKISNDTKLTKTKQYSTNEEVLQSLISTHPIIQKILDYRGLTKLLSTYVDALPKLVNTTTNKIHTSFNQTIAATGRLSSTNPNLQNIPIRDENGKEMRRAFVPSSSEYIIVSADYSQIELRIMAHVSNDENMLQAFASGADIHTATAAKVFNIPLTEVTREQRSKAKTANFGIIYGISAFGLSQRLNIPRKEANELIEGYFKSFPMVRRYMTNCIVEAKEKGYVETLLNRKRFLPDINANNANVRGMAERNAINSPIQGSAADIIKIAMINIHKVLTAKQLKTKMILQVHDELLFDVYKPELEEVKQLIKFNMENAIKLNVSLLVDIGIGENWLEAH